MTGLPLLLELTGRRVVVVGAGAVGLRRVRTLAEAGAQVHVVAPDCAADPTGLPASVQLRGYRDGDLDGAWLAVAATDDPEVNARVARDAEDRRIFCVRADRATEGTARFPAVYAGGELTVSVNAGDDPLRAARLRDAIGVALTTGALPSRPVRPARQGSVALVGGGPGDPELITVRGRRLLFEAEVVVTDRLAPRGLLAELDPSVEVIDCGKAAHRHNLTQQQINEVLLDRARAGKRVVRLKGGDPFVFGRGGEEVAACVAGGVAVQVVPGISSAIAAPAAAGIPVTHRGMAADFAVLSGHRDGGAVGPGWNWPELAVGPATLILLMAMDNLAEITALLIEHGRPAGTPAAAVHRATLPGQRVVRSRLDRLARDVAAAGLVAPAVVIIGATAALGGEPAAPPAE